MIFFYKECSQKDNGIKNLIYIFNGGGKMIRRQKIYRKIGRFICEGLAIIGLDAIFIGMLAIYLMK